MTPGASKEEGGHLLRTVDGNLHHLQKQCWEEQKGREERKVAVLCLLCQRLPQIISCCLLDGRRISCASYWAGQLQRPSISSSRVIAANVTVEKPIQHLIVPYLVRLKCT